jgi:hypothetical protein
VIGGLVLGARLEDLSRMRQLEIRTKDVEA